MKLIAYTRVSTNGQAEHGYGLAAQAQAIRAWAKGKHRIVRVITEPGKSGTLDETERPGLLDVLRAIKGKEADGVVVFSLDRLARLLHVQEAVLTEVWKAGGKVYSTDVDGSGEVLADDADDPMRTFVRQVLRAVAQLDRALSLKRMRNGKAEKVRQGGRPSGRAPYGWRAKYGELSVDEQEQGWLERMAAWRKQGKTLADIAQRLNDNGIKPKGYTEQKPTKWHPASVAYVLKRAQQVWEADRQSLAGTPSRYYPRQR
jgi:DNA invertase Pin-like site-specific DNA recombinase